MRDRRAPPPPWNPNTTQDIREALIDAGRQDLADGIVMQGIRNLEAKVDSMGYELQGVKNALAERQPWTESGIWKTVKIKLEEETIDWMKWAVRGCAGAIFVAFLGLIGWVLKLAWKGLTT